MSIFKACDIRGVYPSSLDEEASFKIGAALGTMLNSGSVLVAGDVRLSTPSLKDHLIKGLISAGCVITDIGTAPTPAFYYALGKLGIESGVIVTASHNPAKYNGYKIAPFGKPMTEDVMSRLRSMVETGSFITGRKGSISQSSILEGYKQHVLDSLDALLGLRNRPPKGTNKLKVVVDCGNGCYSEIAPEVMRKAGMEVEELFCWEDGSFPNREPNPAVAAHLTALSDKVKECGADLGVAFDGDGDRVVFIDESGFVIPSDNAIAIFADYLLSSHPGASVIYDIKCSSLVSDTVRKAGGNPVMEKSGHAFIKNNLLASGALFAGEISGHFFFSVLGGDDGLFAALLMAKIIETGDKSLKELVDDQPKYFTTKDFRIPFSQDVQGLFERLRADLGARSDCRLSFLDGVRADFDNGWALIRASVTEPLVTLRFEGKSIERLEDIRDTFLQADENLLEKVVSVWEGHLP